MKLFLESFRNLKEISLLLLVTIVFQGEVNLLSADVEPQLGLEPELEMLGEHQPGRGEPGQQRHEAGEADGLPTLCPQLCRNHPVHRAHRGLLHARPAELGHHHPQQDLLVPRMMT